jgi:hypothetical protein
MRMMRVFFLTLPLAAVLTGCAPFILSGLVVLTSSANQAPNYVRTDGGPFDAAQRQAALDQCRGEATNEAKGILLSKTEHEITLTKACMARNGYILAQ